eukprot:scaffold767_cov288-Chaetoceros_neogracile.AAC.5
MDKPNGPFMHNTIPKGSMGCIAQQITYNLNPPPLAIHQDKNINIEDYDEGLILCHCINQDGRRRKQRNTPRRIFLECAFSTFNRTNGEKCPGPSLEALTKIHQF